MSLDCACALCAYSGAAIAAVCMAVILAFHAALMLEPDLKPRPWRNPHWRG